MLESADTVPLLGASYLMRFRATLQGLPGVLEVSLVVHWDGKELSSVLWIGIADQSPNFLDLLLQYAVSF